MIEKIIKNVIVFIGVCLGIGVGIYCSDLLVNSSLGIFESNVNKWVLNFTVPTLFGLIFYFIFSIISKRLIRISKKVVEDAQREIEKISPEDFFTGIIGLLGGLLIGLLFSTLFKVIPISIVANALSVLGYLFFAYLGVSLAQKNLTDKEKFKEILSVLIGDKNTGQKYKTGAKPKVLDTSVIIDGRILDICKTGFIEGDVVIPEFVLKELRHIADSSDGLKRNRGRRGLDILKMMQEDALINVKIVDTDFEEVKEVDIKLIKLAIELNGFVVTNDYNLNKVALLHEVQILNINELANAIKPVVLPGEEMIVTVLKEGKEQSQGVAYLDDGTMIVVEDGRKHIGKTKPVIVTSILQTAAGRMIFAKPQS